MKPVLLTQICIALIAFLVLLPLLGRRIMAHKALLALFFGVYFGDNLIHALTSRYENLQLIHSHTWGGFLICNWSGKIYSILFVLVLLILVRNLISRREAGLTLEQGRGSGLPALLIVLGLSAWALLVGFNSPKGELDLKTLVYLAVLPGINEELVYRGVLLTALDKVLPGRVDVFGARIGWGVLVTTLVFALLHGFRLDGSLQFQVNLISLRNSAVSGFVFAWLRVRTGSLLAPVIGHGLEDVLFFLPRML